MISDILPDGTIYINIRKNLEKGFDYREISIER